MARDIGTERTLDVLVNCKTYPAVSKKYVETVCTGGIARDGSFCRLYPIPFRLLDEKQQYERWDVIRVKVYKDTKDPRPESWHIERGVPIQIIETISSEKQRWGWMQKSVVHPKHFGACRRTFGDAHVCVGSHFDPDANVRAVPRT